MYVGGCENCPQRDDNRINVATGRTYCEDCYVQLRPENEEIARIYIMVRDQFIMGYGGPVAINSSVIYQAMDLYKVPEEFREDMFKKVVELCNLRIAQINKKTKR